MGPPPAVRAIAVVCGLLCAPPLSLGAETSCPGDAGLRVRSESAADADLACQGARRAIDFLATLGLSIPETVAVDVVSNLPPPASPNAFGCHVRGEQRVAILSYERCVALGTKELVVDPALYRSLVAHEVAHRVAEANFSVTEPTLVAQEYIAYVTLFATLPPAERERLLAAFPGSGFGSAREMSAVYYGLSPNGFGAQAYRHFLKPGNGALFVRHILSGQVLTDHETTD